MDWLRSQLPVMRLERRFGDRVVPAFCERPANLWAMILEAAARKADGEALICGGTRLTWRQTVERSARIAAGSVGKEPRSTSVGSAESGDCDA